MNLLSTGPGPVRLDCGVASLELAALCAYISDFSSSSSSCKGCPDNCSHLGVRHIAGFIIFRQQ